MDEKVNHLVKEAHIGIAPLTITKDRSAVVDFSTPFLQFQLGILQAKRAVGAVDDDDDDDETQDRKSVV